MEVQVEIEKKRNSKISMEVISAILEFCKKRKLEYTVMNDVIKILK